MRIFIHLRGSINTQKNTKKVREKILNKLFSCQYFLSDYSVGANQGAVSVKDLFSLSTTRMIGCSEHDDLFNIFY